MGAHLPIILASSSPRRRDLMEEAGLAFEVVPAEIDELAEDLPASLPLLTEANAALKAGWVSERFPEALVVGADTLVSLEGRTLGKPRDLHEAFRMLSALAGRTHKVCTGVCLRRGDPPAERRFHAVTKVTFRPLSEAETRAYLARIDPLDKAGAYAAQDHGEDIIARIEGSWTNVVGLPMEAMAAALAAFPPPGAPD